MAATTVQLDYMYILINIMCVHKATNDREMCFTWQIKLKLIAKHCPALVLRCQQ